MRQNTNILVPIIQPIPFFRPKINFKIKISKPVDINKRNFLQNIIV